VTNGKNNHSKKAAVVDKKEIKVVILMEFTLPISGRVCSISQDNDD